MSKAVIVIPAVMAHRACRVSHCSILLVNRCPACLRACVTGGGRCGSLGGTDDQRVEKAVQAFGGKAIMTATIMNPAPIGWSR